MNERIVFTNPDGSVGVIIPTGEIPTSEVMQKDVPAGATNARFTDITALPVDRLFHGAWDDSNPEEKIGVNLSKAKTIAHEIRRAKRNEVFKPHLEITSKAAQGIPLKASENATEAAIAMDTYKTTVDDVAQLAIDAVADGVAVDDSELRAIVTSLNGRLLLKPLRGG